MASGFSPKLSLETMASHWLQAEVASPNPNVGGKGEAEEGQPAAVQKMTPNVEAPTDAGGKRGEEKPALEGLEGHLETAFLGLLKTYGLSPPTTEAAGSTEVPTASSSSRRMVEQECQTDVVGIIPVARRAQNKMSGAAEGNDLLKTGDAEETAPVAGMMEAVRIRLESEEDCYAVDGGKDPHAAEDLVVLDDGSTWERHYHPDGRQYS